MFGLNPINLLINGGAEAVGKALAYLAGALAGWLMTTSKDICPTTGSNPATWDPNWLQTCNQSASAAQHLQHLMLPLTGLVLAGGLLWQATLMVITRKGEPLLQAGRGLVNTALWGGIGIGAAHLMLKAGDVFSAWVIDQSVAGDGNPTEKMRTVVLAMVSAPDNADPLLGLTVSSIAMIFIIAQILLMVFRDGGVIFLAGTKQFSAAGKTLSPNNEWDSKTTSWLCTLCAYKPMMALIYATAWRLLHGEVRDMFTGLSIVMLSVIAMPALMKFFTIFTGHIANAGGGLASAAAGAGAALHATASLRGAGGNSAAEHARYMDSTGPGSTAPTGAAPQPASPLPTPSAGSPGGTSTAAASAAGPVLVGTVHAATGAARAAGNAADSATGGRSGS
ncbi:hypothetical protein [Actinoplanes sp. L3-i22]|uniref:hypothetical protein n=1 Tax=Actinoplanes sp. L3-i22 TaxID=2836373 RepID=UPI001C7584EC|nr:hypothetical protein [Actinoplanes sp. L3-i22]BCY10975.1 hypothetical protein L3i22_060630 [Actinoplanes sp. L3-i22]